MRHEPIPMSETTDASGAVREHVWGVPPTRDFLEPFLREMFDEQYEGLVFGPLIPGAAYELKAPGKPKRIDVSGGYLTVHWGRQGHFHLCIEKPEHSPREADGGAGRSPGRAELYRMIDKNGLPTSWGFRLFNGRGDPQIAIFFPNPYMTDDDAVTQTPDWSRLALWDHVMANYAGHGSDPYDRTGQGFGTYNV